MSPFFFSGQSHPIFPHLLANGSVTLSCFSSPHSEKSPSLSASRCARQRGKDAAAARGRACAVATQRGEGEAARQGRARSAAWRALLHGRTPALLSGASRHAGELDPRPATGRAWPRRQAAPAPPQGELGPRPAARGFGPGPTVTTGHEHGVGA